MFSAFPPCSGMVLIRVHGSLPLASQSGEMTDRKSLHLLWGDAHVRAANGGDVSTLL